METKKKRGCLNPEVQKIAKGFLGREITTRELRLYPYIDYCIKNDKPEQINEEKDEIDLDIDITDDFFDIDK